jgi:hypothetical protein
LQLSEARGATQGLVDHFRQRSSAELDHAKRLQRVSESSEFRSNLQLETPGAAETPAFCAGIGEFEKGALREALLNLVGDASNRAEQHRELSAKIEEEIIVPLERVRDIHDKLIKTTSDARKDIRAFRYAGDRCRKLYGRFQQAFSRAQVAASALERDGPMAFNPPDDSYWDITPPPKTREERVHSRAGDHREHASVSDAHLAAGADTQRVSGASDGTSRMLSGFRSMFSSPPDKHTQLVRTYESAMESSAVARHECVQAWADYAKAKRAFLDTVGGMIAVMEDTERARKIEIARVLRMFAVFESFCWASLQDDTQRIAGTFEEAEEEIRVTNETEIENDKKTDIVGAAAEAERVTEARSSVPPSSARRASAAEIRRSVLAHSPGPVEYLVALLFLDSKPVSAVLGLLEEADLEDALFGDEEDSVAKPLEVSGADALLDGDLVALPFSQLLYLRAPLHSTLRMMTKPEKRGRSGSTGDSVEIIRPRAPTLEAMPHESAPLPSWVRRGSLGGFQVLIDTLHGASSTVHMGSEAEDASVEALKARPVSLVRHVLRLIATAPDAVERLSAALDDRRSRRRDLSPEAWKVLAELLNRALTQCLVREDFERGLRLMVLCNTFYTTSDEAFGPDASSSVERPGEPSSRVYLRIAVRNHLLWREDAFWKFALFQQVGNEIEKVPPDGSAGVPQADVIFGQLGFFAFNMVSFGLPSDRVEPLLRTYAKFASLSDEDWARLSVMTQGFRDSAQKELDSPIPSSLETVPSYLTAADDSGGIARRASSTRSASAEAKASTAASAPPAPVAPAPVETPPTVDREKELE